MKKLYSEQIFVATATDTAETVIVSDDSFIKFAEHCHATLDEVIAVADGLKIEQNDDLYLLVYRKVHVIATMATIFQIAKIDHLLTILDFVFDHVRYTGNIKVSSIDYMIKVLGQTARNVLFDYQKNASSALAITDVLEEASRYLLPILTSDNAETRSPFFASQEIEPVLNDVVNDGQTDNLDKAPMNSAAVEPAPEVAPTPQTAPQQVTGKSDLKAPAVPKNAPSLQELQVLNEPEALQIPLDKIGMISDFCEESRENLTRIGQILVEIENAEPAPDSFNELFRAIHTLKGGARLLKIRKIEVIAHNTENLLDELRQGRRTVNPEIIDILLSGKQGISEMVEEVASRGPLLYRVGPLLNKLVATLNGQSDNSVQAKKEASAPVVEGPSESGQNTAAAAATPAPSEAKPAEVTVAAREATSEKKVVADPAAAAKHKNTESIRVSSEKLDEVLNTASEIFLSRIRFQNDLASLRRFLKSFKSTLLRVSETPNNTIEHRRADGGCEDMTLHEELNLNFLSVDEIQKQFQKTLENLEHLSARLQTGAMSFRMVPISTLLERFPVQIRELARNMNKRVRVDITGGDTELDKVLITKLADPIMHMLRNSLDHGIEMPESRLKSGKPEIGLISIRSFYHGSYAVVEIKDDGAGLNVEKIFQKAVDKGLVEASSRAKLTDREIFNFVFLPGFSTADKVTEISGRGVGMDVVRTAINQLQGNIEIDSAPQMGTTFKLRIPLTLAIVKILIVKDARYQFAIPILNVEEIVTVNRADIQMVSGNYVTTFRGQSIAVSSLSKILGFSRSRVQDEMVNMVVLTEGRKQLGIMVDEVIGREEILVKNLGLLLKHVPFIMGCTILKDSNLVLILDPSEMINAPEKHGSSMIDSRDDRRVISPINKKSRNILIIDDSLIQRENLQNILRNAGFATDAVENGFEGLKALRHKNYAAFCVDIVMPLMDGYEFVTRLRKIDGYKDTPVYLVTGRDIAGDDQRAAGLNITAKFNKPVDEEALVNEIDTRLIS